MTEQALLYSFRRCPYAMRARMALIFCQLPIRVREVALKDKPAELLALNPKGTVPVLVSGDTLLTESLDIMLWATKQSSQAAATALRQQLPAALALITANDEGFKPWLDKYKYFDRHPQFDQSYYRDNACEFIAGLDDRLSQSTMLLGEEISLADLAIFPFVRQFAGVEPGWLDTNYPKVARWLDNHLASKAFAACMYKYPLYQQQGDTLPLVLMTG
ncbi:glutathione S-transferase [Shewanella litorisediminis]|uniref:Glutathione S-transferase n=1 Tax=Shewanella litorisediminis TaxID=1173586 RepID=A0ABX7G2B9_9GAMM|nr:glutathione S-transferase [Shewanella litorisediminis]MCL2918496.1 glutathione S-transferase [Shewanella litorisediminis]QRH01328.1 glutathione S-transferase [Shewanella litorisediminis]